MKPQDADGKLPSSFMFGPQFTERMLYQLCSPEVRSLAGLFLSDGPKVGHHKDTMQSDFDK
jgi:hypothetical protein